MVSSTLLSWTAPDRRRWLTAAGNTFFFLTLFCFPFCFGLIYLVVKAIFGYAVPLDVGRTTLPTNSVRSSSSFVFAYLSFVHYSFVRTQLRHFIWSLNLIKCVSAGERNCIPCLCLVMVSCSSFFSQFASSWFDFEDRVRSRFWSSFNLIFQVKDHWSDELRLQLQRI
jgi:hypothetical protein